MATVSYTTSGDMTPQDGEERFKVIGIVGEKLFTGVFVWRNDRPRFMSVRRSNDGERRAYHAAG